MKESSGNILLCGGVLYDSELLMLHLDHLLNKTHTSKKKKKTLTPLKEFVPGTIKLLASLYPAYLHILCVSTCVCVCVP